MEAGSSGQSHFPRTSGPHRRVDLHVHVLSLLLGSFHPQPPGSISLRNMSRRKEGFAGPAGIMLCMGLALQSLISSHHHQPGVESTGPISSQMRKVGLRGQQLPRVILLGKESNSEVPILRKATFLGV